MEARGGCRGDTTTGQQTDANRKRGAIGRGCGRGRVKRTAEVLTRQPAGKQDTTLLVAKEKTTAMATKNAAPMPSLDGDDHPCPCD